ncbi:hypothetical protein GGQ99_000951 [Aminobacter niigataensis]|uniref:Bacteriophage T5 Orf172 DNA-binding domain-containing protein n=1 Tax=Aminobacter niigataensis TaxID=83265 RepID=A0ABR6KZ78_9HYPH|nr:GIY-YIG nuclease family protein [Aminobacter niigataensis]MBB4649229.1 hypothetical protein [Aminobacter niigataensis]
MPKKSPHPHVNWRDGKPRFSPGQALRVAGHKGLDLRHPDGRWYSFGEAIDWSNNFTKTIDKPSPLAKSGEHPATKGYVYFLGVRDRVKIGYSANPGQRLMSLKTSAADPVHFFFSVPGTRYDERRLHTELESHRSSGEWFKRSLTVIRAMQRHLSSHIDRLNFDRD